MTTKTFDPIGLADEEWSSRADVREYSEPADVAVGRNGLVYVLTRGPGEVLVYDGAGLLQGWFGADVLSDRPHAITVDSAGTTYIVDCSRARIAVFDPDGAFMRYVGDGTPIAEIGTANSATSVVFDQPTKVAVAGDGDLYVTDGYGLDRILRMTIDGTLIDDWGGSGDEPGHFELPHSIAVLHDGRLAVCDRENDRVQFFGGLGNFLGEWTGMQRPASLCELSDGRICIAHLSWQPGELTKRGNPGRPASPASLGLYTPDGTLERRQLQVRSGGRALVAPHGIAADSFDTIFVAEVGFTRSGLSSDNLHRIPVRVG